MNEMQINQVLEDLKKAFPEESDIKCNDEDFLIVHKSKNYIYRQMLIKKKSNRIGLYGNCFEQVRAFISARVAEFENCSVVIPNGPADSGQAVWFNARVKGIDDNWYESRDKIIDAAKMIYDKLHEWHLLGDVKQFKGAVDAIKNGVTGNNTGVVAPNTVELMLRSGAAQAAPSQSSPEGKTRTQVDDRPRNRIVFGAPGTGKSHRLNEEAQKSFTDANSERVTFYATYSYAQFVGTYKPVMKDVGGEEKIAYEFVPGPFLRMLVKAVNEPDPERNYLLIIEEINRANAAAVFGDVFQLLDRTDAGESEYPIGASEDVVRYLNGVANGKPILSLQGKKFFGMVRKIQETVADDDLAPENWTPTGECKLRLPKNLYIWATMNSADQGVFPLDTAFKRRWSFEYIGIDEGEPQAPDLKIQIKNETYDWKTLRKFLNRLLILNGVNEDKLMGPFFLKNASEFNSKVLMYLWEDAARMCRRAVFGEIKTYSDLCDKWEEKGIKIFDVAKFDDTKLNGCREALQPKDDAAAAQETNND